MPALVPFRDRFLGEVDVDRSGERVGDDQRRAREKVGAYLLMNACLEVPVAREHARGHQVIPVDGFLDLRGSSGPELPMQVVQP